LLKGKVAVITGATRGIGFEIAKEFAARGATVIVCSVKMESAEKSASLIKDKAYTERLDVTDPVAVAKSMRQLVESHKHVDILVDNARYPLEYKIWAEVSRGCRRGV